MLRGSTCFLLVWLTGCTARTDYEDLALETGDEAPIDCAALTCDDGNVCNGIETCEPTLGCVAGTALPGGTLDPSFGTAGVVLTDLSAGGTDQAKSIAVSASGQIRVGAQSRGVTFNDYSAVALHPDGSLDLSFDFDGLFKLDSGGNDVQRSMAVGPNGEWLLVGSSSRSANIEGSMLLVAEDASPVSSFGAGGLSFITGPAEDIINDAVWSPDGELYIAGVIDDAGAGSTSDGFVARVLASGSVDPTFGSGGIARLGLGGRALVWALWLQGARIYVGGHTFTGANNDILVAAFDTNGDLDPSFAGTGIKILDVGADDQLRGLVIDADGRIVVSGYGGIASRGMYVGRLTPNGELDTTFGTGGWTVVAPSPGMNNGNRIAIDFEGRILLAGLTDYGGTAPQSALVRLMPDGTPDPDFGVGGAALWSLANDDLEETLRDVVVDAEGRILAAGWANTGTDNDILTLRVCP